MLNKTLYIERTNEATPDEVFVPEWDYVDKFYNSDYIAFIYLDGTLYMSNGPTAHPMMYGKYKFRNHGLDGRIWVPQRWFTFWFDSSWTKDRLLDDIRKTRRLLLESNYTPFKAVDVSIPPIDISGYTFIFMGIIDGEQYIIECDYDTFFSEDFELMDTAKLRMFRPFRKYDLRATDTPYRKSCKWWSKKIGGMDVAEWHLLMYEE